MSTVPIKLGLSASCARLLSAAASCVALVAPALLHQGPVVPRITRATNVSTNWSGYVVRPGDRGRAFRSVSGSWVVPAGSCTPGRKTYSATWVGLGGYRAKSRALEQIGTELDCATSGDPVYTAWYELVPEPGVDIDMPVEPGDRIDASVAVAGRRVTMMLRNRTRKLTFQRAFSVSAPEASSAEWIVEAPTVCTSVGGDCSQGALSSFGTISFSAARVAIAGDRTRGRNGSIDDPRWRATRLHMRPSEAHADGDTVTGSRTSALSRRGSRFSVVASPVSP